MTMKTIRYAVLALAGLVAMAQAENIRSPYFFWDTVDMIGQWKINGTSVDATAAEINAVADASLNAGTVSANATVAESPAKIEKTTLAVSLADLAIDNGGLTTNKLLYTFPEGRILVLGVVATLVSTNSANFEASNNDHYSFGLGGAGNGDATSDAGEVTFLAAKDCDTAAGTELAFTNKTATALFVADGTTTAAPLWAHIWIANTQDTAANTFGLTGSVVVTWCKLGDY